MHRRLFTARELAVVFVLYAFIATAASWPLARDFRTFVVGDIWYDQRHAIWSLWHLKEALLGRQALFYADGLYHPLGISTLVDGVGILSGVLALPFWPWGPAAAYNGANWLGLTLTGWCMYLLARFGATSAALCVSAIPRAGAATDAAAKEDDGSRLARLRAAAFLAGVVFQLYPIHLAGLHGHTEKAFVGLMPLTVLAGLFAYDPARSRAWWAAPGIVLLLALLHNGNHFMFGAIALVVLAALCTVTRESGRVVVAWPVARRVVAAGVVSIVIVAPLLLKIAAVARDPRLITAYNTDSLYFTPDVLQFVTPSLHQATAGLWFFADGRVNPWTQSRTSVFTTLNSTGVWQGSGVETAATIPLSVIALILVAWRGRYAGVGRWLLLAVPFVVFALGVSLRIAGWTAFTVFKLPIVLPYAFLVSLPGFDVMRTPVRFMMMGSVSLAILAAWGLLAWTARAPRRASLIALVVTAIVLVESWPRAWPQQALPPVPEFYQRLASDPDRYAVLDLPRIHDYYDFSSAYMYYQLTHEKGIAWANISRTYREYPLTGLQWLFDDQQQSASNATAPNATGPNPSAPKEPAPDAVATRARLAELGYRYVVWHKRADELFVRRTPEDVRAYVFRRLARKADAHPLIRTAFANDMPVVDDDLVTVYRVTP